MTENEIKELQERAKICLGVYEEMNNRLFDLHERYDFNASELMMIVGNLSASVLKAIEKNCVSKEAEEEIEETFIKLVKSTLTITKAADKRDETPDVTSN